MGEISDSPLWNKIQANKTIEKKKNDNYDTLC